MRKNIIIITVSVIASAYLLNKFIPVYKDKVLRMKNKSKATEIAEQIKAIKVSYDGITEKFIGTNEDINKMLKLRGELQKMGYDYNIEMKTIVEFKTK